MTAETDKREKPLRKALGRGIDSLIPNLDSLTKREDYFLCDIGLISPNPMQPRQTIAEGSLDDLVASIKEMGIIQPLIVRTARTGYELIAGERRLRAAGLAGLKKVPVIVKEASSKEMLELALIENIQRKDLNPLEEAEAYHRLTSEFGLTQEQVAVRVGKDRSTVANFLRVLSLPEPIRQDILNGVLTMGHARVLAGIEKNALQRKAWNLIVSRRLSVRGAEDLAKSLKVAVKSRVKPKDATSKDIYFRSLEENLSQRLGTKVAIKRSHQDGRGVLEIDYYSDNDLERLMALMTGRLKAEDGI
ncbi:MAG: ParB/RepB/Spo0J family partition protein [Pseudomonadota bacterium]